MGFFAEAGPVQIFVSNHVSFIFQLFIVEAVDMVCFCLYYISWFTSNFKSFYGVMAFVKRVVVYIICLLYILWQLCIFCFLCS
jgi:hypothetical protein